MSFFITKTLQMSFFVTYICHTNTNTNSIMMTNIITPAQNLSQTFPFFEDYGLVNDSFYFLLITGPGEEDFIEEYLNRGRVLNFFGTKADITPYKYTDCDGHEFFQSVLWEEFYGDLDSTDIAKWTMEYLKKHTDLLGQAIAA